jgi:serine/threonine protein kinase
MHQGSADTRSDPSEENQKGMRLFFFYQRYTECASYQAFGREIDELKSISHPNILPIIEVSETLFPFCIVSPWMPDGNITQYIKTNPSADRLMLVRSYQFEDK